MFSKKKSKSASIENVDGIDLIESGGAQPIQPVGVRPIAINKKADKDRGFVTVMVVLSIIFVCLFCATAYKITAQQERIKSLEAEKQTLIASRFRRDFGISSPEYLQLKFLTEAQAVTIRKQANTIRDLESKVGVKPEKSSNDESRSAFPIRVAGSEPMQVILSPGFKQIDPKITSEYLQDVKERISSHWYPPNVPHGPIGAQVTISSYGKTVSSYLNFRSGDNEVDKALIEAVQRAAPYETIPPEFESDSISLQVVIGAGTGHNTMNAPTEAAPTKPIHQDYRPVDAGSSGGSGSG
ncbi:MAG TPA: TonB C-terminal domain-containing protein [Oculatellaceae cyanobacterium]